MSITRWWKCDLQVATPAWQFRFPENSSYRIDSDAEIQHFLDAYMHALKEVGIEVIAAADHNTGAWIDNLKSAGERHGIHVFPGCEITTHSGADGVHLLILGSREKTSQDFDRLLHGPLGYGSNSPLYREIGGQKHPAPSSKTLIQILDDLPDGYLAIAPHALGENGIASSDTVKGEMRWQALHHERLIAIDPGDCSQVEGDSFNARFRRREQSNFPCLDELAFISTSDAYSLSDLGKRFTWLRMGEVSLEALRQALIDRESRVICDWDERLATFQSQNPNNIRHAWVSEIKLGGELGNSKDELTISLHPNLNVLIGGRGSGKSTVVAALRQLYSTTSTLPERLRADAELFCASVFQKAELSAVHFVDESQSKQVAAWNRGSGSRTIVDGQEAATQFRITVIGQKELFERAAGDKNDPFISSRSLLSLLDSSIGYEDNSAPLLGTFARSVEDARAAWAKVSRDHYLLESDLRQLPLLTQREKTLQEQVNAFSAPEVKQRLSRIQAKENESNILNKEHQRIVNAIIQLEELHATLISSGHEDKLELPIDSNFEVLRGLLQGVTESMSQKLEELRETTVKALEEFDANRQNSDWQKSFEQSKEDLEAYKAELAAKGLSPHEFSRLQDELSMVRLQIRQLAEQSSKLTTLEINLELAWKGLTGLYDFRRDARNKVLEEVRQKSGRLRFSQSATSDTTPWVNTFRTIAGFRTDAFTEDVPKLASWLWLDCPEETPARWQNWRRTLVTCDSQNLQQELKARTTFIERILALDESIRLRLATLVPDDVVSMEFLKEGGSATNENDWQSVATGSPGQRTAAMLAFVLHHGHEPLVLDQPEDDLDSDWISRLVVKELRQSRWRRQLIVVSHNANIPVLGDADQIVALENHKGVLRVRSSKTIQEGQVEHQSLHIGPVENLNVRSDIQNIMEGGVSAFVKREKKYNNETKQAKSKR